MNTQFRSILIAGLILFPLGYAMEHAEEGRKRPLFESTSYPCKMVKITDEKPINGMEELTSRLKILSHSIHQAHQEADAATIERAYDDFLELSKVYKPYDWQRAKLTMTQWIHPSYLATRLYQWPSQTTDQELIGGHLFYPPHLNDLLDCPYTEDLVQRKDYVFALGAAAHHHHSLARYYLLRTLENMSLVSHTEMDEEYRAFFHNHYQEVLDELEKHCQDHPDACYVLGNNYNCALFGRMSIVEFDPLKAYQFFTKGKDVRNRLAALELRQYRVVVFPIRPTINEYLTLAHGDPYGPAFIAAVDLMEELEEDETKRLSLLHEALQLPYYPALMELAYFYQEKGDKEKALHYFVEAGKRGISEGYIQAGILIGGYFPPLTLGSKKSIKSSQPCPTIRSHKLNNIMRQRAKLITLKDGLI